MARVQLVGISKRFAQTTAVEVVDLDIAEGEFLTLLGGSGCGKSTTLRLIAGLEAPSSGHILFDDEDVTVLAPQERNVAMVFQSYALYPHKTVAGNLAFPLLMRRMPKAEIASHVREVAQLLRIEELLGRKPRELSGGQQQRVALGRALIRRPRVFLLDEPLSNLDARLRVALRREIKMLHQTVRTTLVYVTHDQEEAMMLSDRIAVMHAGRVLQCAPPREIYASPADLTVAELVGSPTINLLDAEVQATALTLPGEVKIAIPSFQAERFAAVPRHLRLGIRPEHLHIMPDSGPGRGIVRQIEQLGKETHVVLDCDSYTLTARVEADCSLRLGQTVTWSWQWEHVLCFDLHSGKNLHA
ncbi:MAG TPA: ABC transporter ATP-binding protein [Candidatus Binatia bacterium]|jgi:multiple sugar transport system ATP-binding protein|nr:ABC transporter ATP-binding protein [Candidatus Binatia bacterium]